MYSFTDWSFRQHLLSTYYIYQVSRKKDISKRQLTSLSSRSLWLKLKAHADLDLGIRMRWLERAAEYKAVGSLFSSQRGSRAPPEEGKKGLSGSRVSVSPGLLSNNDLVIWWSHYLVVGFPRSGKESLCCPGTLLFCFLLCVVCPALL